MALENERIKRLNIVFAGDELSFRLDLRNIQTSGMRLELSRVVQGCRLGVLTGLGKSGQHSLEVPGCLLYTRCATVPHLTQDTLHTLRDLPSVTQVSVDSL